MSFLDDIAVRDLDENTAIEATCIRCLHFWLMSPLEVLLRVGHRDVKLSEVADNLSCPKPGCRNVGARVTLVNNDDTSGFVGGMP